MTNYIIQVSRSRYGSKLNKLTENHDFLLLVTDYTEADLDSLKLDPEFDNALIYVKHVLWGENHDYLKPLHDVPNTVGCMYGGNNGILANGTVLRIHDRYETQKQYNMYSA